MVVEKEVWVHNKNHIFQIHEQAQQTRPKPVPGDPEGPDHQGSYYQ